MHFVRFRRVLQFVLLISITLIFSKTGNAQEFQSDLLARFTTWNTQDGLGDDLVLDILEDRYGIMWFATGNGLTRFDGHHFTRYKHDLKDSTSLSDNTITAISEDPEGNLWIGTVNGLNKLERFSGRFTRFYAKEGKLPHNHIKTLYADKEGHLWIESIDNIFSCYNIKQDTWEHTAHVNPYVEGEYYYHHIIESQDGTLWMGGRAQGVCKITGKDIRTIQYAIHNPQTEYFEGSCFAEGKKGEFFASDDLGNFSRYNKEKNIFETLLHLPIAAICAATDAFGSIWVGGRDGLIRLDLAQGHHTAYRHHPENKFTIPSDKIYCLFSDTRGNVWIGTDRGVSLYSQSMNAIRSYKRQQVSEFLSPNSTTALLEDKDGLLWIGTETDGVDTLNLQTDRMGNLKYEILKENILPTNAEREREILNLYRRHKIPVPNYRINENKVSALYQDSEGQIYIGLWSHVGFNIYNKKKKEFKRYCLWSAKAGFTYPLLLEGNLFGANWYVGFLEDSRSHFWCATWEGAGLNQFDRKKGEFTGMHFIPGTVPRMPWATISTFVQDSSTRKIYLGGGSYYGYYSAGNGVWQRYAEKFPLNYDLIEKHYRYCPARFIDIPTNPSLRVYAFSNNKTWLVLSDALLQHNTLTDEVETVFRLKKISTHSFGTLSYDKKHLYVCWDHVVAKFSLYDNNVDLISDRVKNWNLIPTDLKITALYEAHNGDLVILTGKEEYMLLRGASRIVKKTYFNLPSNQYYTIQNGTTGEIYLGTADGLYQSSVSQPCQSAQLLKSVSVYNLYQERDRIYACTSHGLYILEKKSGTKTHFYANPSQRYSLPHNTVFAISRVRSLNQAVQVPVETSTVKTFIHRLWDTTGIPDNYIGDVFEDSQKNIWIGTNKGLCKYNPNGTFNKISHLSGKEIRRILEDTAGYLWISTHNGLYRYHPSTDNVRVFHSSNGFLNDNYTQAACRLQDGRLAFGGAAGFNLFDPATLNSSFNPPINLTDFRIRDKIIYAYMPKKLSLRYRDNSFSVSFCAANYESGNSIRYRYRLKNFEKEWNYTAPPLLNIKYTNVPGGEYTLEIEAANPFGEWSGNLTASIINIAVPFYRRGWFILLTVCFWIAVIRLYIKWREKNLNKKNKLLENMIAQRTSEIRKEIDSKNRFFSIISHDLKNPLHALGIASGSLYENYSKMTECERLSMLDRIRSSSSNTARLLDALLLWVLSQMDMIRPNYIRAELHSIAISVIELFALQAQEKHIAIENKIEADTIAYTDENMFSTILRNLVSNAVKYSRPGGTVIITAERSGETIYIAVQDEGIGMSERIQNKLFRIDAKVSIRGTAKEEGSGIGLIITSELIGKLGETISVTSREGEGSRFVFSVRNFKSISYE